MTTPASTTPSSTSTSSALPTTRTATGPTSSAPSLPSPTTTSVSSAWRRGPRIMPLKFLGGPDGTGSTLDAADAVAYAEANGARVINASWGSNGESDILKHAVATTAGVAFVAAAGNKAGVEVDGRPSYPAAWAADRRRGPRTPVRRGRSTGTGRCPSSRTVGSNYGCGSVDVGAPGSAIYSTCPVGTLQLVLRHVHGHPARLRGRSPRRRPAGRPLGGEPSTLSRPAHNRLRHSPGSPRPGAW